MYTQLCKHKGCLMGKKNLIKKPPYLSFSAHIVFHVTDLTKQIQLNKVLRILFNLLILNVLPFESTCGKHVVHAICTCRYVHTQVCLHVAFHRLIDFPS